MSEKIIHGRGKEHSELSAFLKDEAPGCKIFGISGYGGVGKTYLVEHVLAEIQPEHNGRLVLRVSGANSDLRGNFMGIVREMLAPQRLEGVPDVRRDFFPGTRKVANVHADILHAAKADLDAKLKTENGSASDNLRRATTAILDAGSKLNKVSKNIKEWVDFKQLKELGLEDFAESAGKLIDELKSLRESSRLPGPIKDLLGLTIREKVRSDLFPVTADAWISDLTAILSGYRGKDIARLTHGRLKDFTRLILVLDDFEIIGQTITEFVVSYLLPGLQKAKFSSHVVLIGRDDLFDVHPGFQQHLATSIRSRFRLEPFSETDAVAFLVDAGYAESEATDLYLKSHGFPFVLDLLASNKGRSALFYQQFYERTTRWMTDKEKEWLLQLCYLDEVNEATIGAMIEGVQPRTVMEWFRNEASVRDTASPVFVVNPFIREMILEYQSKLVGKKKREEMEAKGKQALMEA